MYVVLGPELQAISFRESRTPDQASLPNGHVFGCPTLVEERARSVFSAAARKKVIGRGSMLRYESDYVTLFAVSGRGFMKLR